MKPHNQFALFVIVVGLLVTTAPGAAAAEIGGYIGTQGIQTRGATQLDGPLVAFLRDNPLTTGHSPATFDLTAAALRVESYSHDLRTHPVDVNQEVRETNQYFEAATLAGVENFGNYHFDVLPTSTGSATASLVASCTIIAPSPADSVTVTSQVYKPSPDSKITMDTSKAVTWQGCSGAPAQAGKETLHIKGDFVIAAWEAKPSLRTELDLHAELVPYGPGLLAGLDAAELLQS